MLYILWGLAIVFAAGVGLLVRTIVRRVEPAARPRVALLAVAFAVLVAFALVASLQAGVFYTLPVGVIVGLAVLWLGAAALAIVLAGALGRSGKTYATIAGLFLVTAVATTVVMILSPVGAPVALFEFRAQQIAEANGFTAFLPTGRQMNTESLPVDTFADGTVLAITYDDFVIHERAAAKTLAESDLRAIVEAGESPLGNATVSRDASITVLTLDGHPAVGATFLWARPEAAIKGMTAQDRVVILVFELDGTEIRLESTSVPRFTGRDDDGVEIYEKLPALTLDELVAIAESLAPAD